MNTNPLPQHRLLILVQFVLTTSFALFLMATPAVRAQTGEVTITVRDQQGAVVPGANVTLTKSDTKEAVTRQAEDDGIVRFAGISPGTYTVSVEAAGFAKKMLVDVKIGVGTLQTIDMTLEVGPGIETVTIASEGERERPELLSAVPNLNNDLTPLLQILPGAVPTSPSTLGKIVVDGKGKDQQTIRLDGVDAMALVELPSGDPALDVLSGFQKPEVAFDLDNSNPTQSRAFAPRFGPGTGSVVDGISFRGRTAWAGQLNGEHRNDLFNARNFFDGDEKNGIRRTRFGGRVGGPLDPGNHVLLYLGYDGVRGRTERDIYEAVPAEAACNCAVASFFRNYLPAGTVLIPGASLNPDFEVARRRLHATARSDSWDARLDLTHSSKLVPKFRFTRLAAENVVPDGVTGRVQRQRVVFRNALAQLTLGTDEAVHSFSANLNQTAVRVGTELPQATGLDLSDSLITTGGTVTAQGIPTQSPSVATLGGFGKGSGLRLSPTSYNFSYDQTRPVRFWGKTHQLSLGVETRFVRLSFDRRGGTTYAFPDAAALRAGTPGTITFLSDLNAPSPFGTGAGPRHAAQEYYMGYFQLVSEVRPNLTLTYGLRYDYFGAVRERDNRALVVDPASGEILPPGAPFYRAAGNNFQPRFGLALKSDDTGLIRNMEFRVGAGLYSGVPRIGDLLLPIESDRVSTSFTGGTFPVDPQAVTRAFLDSPDTRQFQPLSFSRDFTTPERAYKWEAQLSRTFHGIYDLKLIYTGNVGRNLPLAGVANQIVSVVTNPDPSQPATVIRQFDTPSGGGFLKPFGEFYYRSSGGRSSYNGLTVQFKRNSKAATDTNTSLPQWLRLADLNVTYTLGRNVGNVSGEVASNPLDFDADYGYNASDARHTLNVTAVYNLWEAFGKGEHEGRRHPLLGLRIAPSLNARSGLPLVVRVDRPDVVYVDTGGAVFSTPAVGHHAVINTPGGAAARTRVPNLVPGVNPYLDERMNILNPAAFTIPAPGTYGDLRRGQLRGPSSVQFDVGVSRYLYSSESVAADLRVDFFNLFNRANFGNPTAVLPDALGTSAADNKIQPGAPFSRAAAPTFGVITAADPGRLIQFSFTLKFKGGFTK